MTNANAATTNATATATMSVCRVPVSTQGRIPARVVKGARDVWVTERTADDKQAGYATNVLSGPGSQSRVSLVPAPLRVRTSITVMLTDTPQRQVFFNAAVTAVRCFKNTMGGADPTLIPNVDGQPDLSQPIEIIEVTLRTHARSKSITLRIYPTDA